jgi:pimeloyl-ACP methyl ester carboxylesterase
MPFVQAADLSVHYLEAGAGEPVIFVHGNWASCGWWEPVLERLPAGYRGLAPDLRGRGKTEGPDSDYSIAALAADLLAFVDALGLDSFHLVGHSLGAGVSMQVALDAPARVITLAVIAPPWADGIPEALNMPDRQRLLKEQPELFRKALKAMAPTAPEDELWARLVDEGYAQRIEAAIGNMRSLVSWRPGNTLAAILAPKLVVGGELDPLIPPAAVMRTAAALGAEPIILDGIGHSPNLEAPDRLIALLAAHLSRAPGTTGEA